MVWQADRRGAVAARPYGGASGFRPTLKVDPAGTGSIRPSVGGAAMTFVRATPASIDDFEGCIRVNLSGEARFRGLRRVYNPVPESEDMTTASWTKQAGVTAPDAESIAYAGGGGVGANRVISATSIWGSPATGRVFHLTFEAKWITQPAGTNSIRANAGNFSGAGFQSYTVTSEWQRFSSGPLTSTGAGSSVIQFASAAGNDDTFTLGLRRVQLEEVTGQANQNPAEYVSNGVLAAPFHGAGADGVKWFPSENNNVVESSIVYDRGPYLALPGAAGAFLSTPDSAALDIVNDIDVRVKAALNDWSPAAITRLIVKGGVSRSFDLLVLTTGQLQWFADGKGGVRTSSFAVSFANGQTGWVRFTRRASDGQILFYESLDGETWDTLGAEQFSAAGDCTANNDIVRVGIYTDEVINPLAGRVYRVEIYNGIEGELAACFDASRLAAGGASTVAGSTGEVWSVNGTGRMTGGRIASATRRGIRLELARTNRCLQAEDFSLTWAIAGTPTRTGAAARCGDLVLDLLGDDTAAVAEYFYQDIVFVGDAQKSVSLHVKEGSSSSSLIMLYDETGAAPRLTAAITWAGGVPSVALTTGTQERAPEQLANGVWRIFLLSTSVTAANTNRLRVYAANTSAGDVSLTGDIYVGGVQCEDALAASSYIRTTTGVVARNVDAYSGPGAGWYRPDEGCFVVDGQAVSEDNSAERYWWSCAYDGSNHVSVYNNNGSSDYDGRCANAGVSQAEVSTGVASVNANRHKIAYSYMENRFSISLDGAAVAEDTIGTPPGAGGYLFRPGASPTGGSTGSLDLASIAYYPSAPAYADLRRLAA